MTIIVIKILTSVTKEGRKKLICSFQDFFKDLCDEYERKTR